MTDIRILAENIIVPYDGRTTSEEADTTALSKAKKKIQKALGCKCNALNINKKSIDARRKNDIKLVYSVSAEVSSSVSVSAVTSAGFKVWTPSEYELKLGTEKLSSRPVIAGFGPAGMFCALALAENGYRPIVYERGGDVASRVMAVESFNSTGRLDLSTNIQFGAGGAGTFSDGKLTTRINDPLCSYVLEKFVELGAPSDITHKAKPHIGTDILRTVVEAADRKVRALGGDVVYNTKLCITGDKITANGSDIDYGALVLAVGHSARDTYEELLSSGYAIEPKAFSVGVRIEHLQTELDRAMHGELAGDETLGHAEYNVSYREGDRGVYSFCMCPGGEVVGAASEAGGVVTNGMSRRRRDGANANAALAVSVKQSDYGSTPMDAVNFQRMLERRAFTAGGGDYSAPMQTVGDFLSGKKGTEPTRILPTYRGGKVTPTDLHSILPEFVSDMLEKGITKFGGRIRGFDAEDAILTGVETRTSAPVRLLRGDGFTAFAHDRIYPCGEGAGYAGGIMSAAIDGLKIARAIMERFAPLD